MDPKKEQPEQKENVNKVLVFIDSNKTTRKEIAISEYKGNKYLQIRQVWKKDEKDTEWLFCKKIVTFSHEDLQRMETKLKDADLTILKILSLLE